MHHSMTFEMHFVCFIPAVSFSRIRDAPFRVFHYHLSHRIYSALIIGGATLRGARGKRSSCHFTRVAQPLQPL